MDAVSRDCPTRPTTLALKLKFECYIAVALCLGSSDQVSNGVDQWS